MLLGISIYNILRIQYIRSKKASSNLADYGQDPNQWQILVSERRILGRQANRVDKY